MKSSLRKLAALAAVLVAVVLAAGWGFAQLRPQGRPVGELLPKNSILLLTADGSLLHETAYRQTAAWQAFEESGLSKVFEKVLSNPAIPAEAKQALGVARKVQQQGLWLSVAVDPPTQGPPAAWGMAVIPGAADQFEAVNKLVTAVAAANGEKIDVVSQTVQGRSVRRVMIPGAPAEVGWWADGSHLVVAFGMNAVQSAIATATGGRPNVTTNPLFAKYFGVKRDFEVVGISWLDIASLREMFGAMPVPMPNSPREVTVNSLLTMVGLDKLNHVASLSGYRGKSLWSEVITDAPGPRTGLMALLDQKPFTLADLPPVPRQHRGVAVRSWDWKKAYTTGLEIVTKVAEFGPPDAKSELQQALAEIPKAIGFTPEELLGTLGSINCLYTDSMQGGIGVGGVGIVSVTNAAKLKEYLIEGLSRGSAMSDGEMQVQTNQRGEFTLINVIFPEAPFIAPVLAVSEKWLILGATPQSVESQILRTERKLPATDLATAITPEINAISKSYTSLAVMDPRDFYTTVIGLSPMLIGMAQVGIRESDGFPEGFELGITPADIPPAELVVANLFPNVVVTTVDATGTHTYSQQSAPGIPLAGGGDPAMSIGAIGVATALLLPAVQQSREAARRAQSKNNLKQFALAMHNHHDVMGSFPRGTIENASVADLENRLSWIVSILPYVDQEAVYRQVDRAAAFDAERNKAAFAGQPMTFLNPAIEVEVGDYGVTHYAGIGGLGEAGPTLPVTDPKAGIFAYDRVTRLRDVLDGTSNTLMISEVTEGTAQPWAKGGKGTIRALTKQPYINGPDGIGSPFPGGMHAGLVDGSVRFISETIDPSLMERLAAMRDGLPVGDF